VKTIEIDFSEKKFFARKQDFPKIGIIKAQMIMIFGNSILNYLEPTSFPRKSDLTVGAVPS
jgi:hypothetical protein